MKAFILDGSSRDDVMAQNVRAAVIDEVKRHGWDVDVLSLCDTAIAGCMGCFDCWIKTPGTCVIPDAGREVARRIVNSDLLALITPVTFGGYSSTLKKALDRMIPILLPFFEKIDGEVHHKIRYPRNPVYVGIGLLPGDDQESERIFRKLIERNAMNSHSPAHAALVVSGGMGSDIIRSEFGRLLSSMR
jgi:hypothetical protein